MQIERGTYGEAAPHELSGGFPDKLAFYGWKQPPASSPPASFSPQSPLSPTSIDHQVSKLDTLAGVAIKYGVEVSDIRRINGLVTDLQMFAHKKLQIPLPGRHPPSPTLSNDSPNQGHRDDALEQLLSFSLKSQQQQRASPAMNTLQRFYSLTERTPKNYLTKGLFYGDGKACSKEDGNGLLSPCSPYSGIAGGSFHRRSKSFANGFNLKNGVLDDNMVISDGKGNVESDSYCGERSVRRRTKAEVDPPELLMQAEKGGDFLGRSGKSLIARLKTGRADAESARLRTMQPADSSMSNGMSAVRKSSSTSNLEGSDAFSTRATTKWVFNTDTIAKPFEGLPNPLTSRRNKEALD